MFNILLTSLLLSTNVYAHDVFDGFCPCCRHRAEVVDGKIADLGLISGPSICAIPILGRLRALVPIAAGFDDELDVVLRHPIVFGRIQPVAKHHTARAVPLNVPIFNNKYMSACN